METPISFGVGGRLVARVDDRAGRRRGARDLLADVLGALAQAVVEAARRLEHLAGAREYLPRDEERDQRLGQPLERHVAADEIALVAAVLVLEAEDAALHLGLSLARPTSVRPGVGSAPRAGCAGTCAAPSSGPTRPPRDRAR